VYTRLLCAVHSIYSLGATCVRRALLSVYRALLSVNRGVLSVYRVYRVFSTQEPCMHSKELYIHSKNPKLHSKEHGIHSKEPCIHSKPPYLHSKESCIHSKEPYVHIECLAPKLLPFAQNSPHHEFSCSFQEPTNRAKYVWMVVLWQYALVKSYDRFN